MKTSDVIEIDSEPHATASAYHQTIWQRLGFGERITVCFDEEEGFAPGSFITRTYVYFDWKDRLRILLSGGINVEVRAQTDVRVTNARVISAVGVLAPGHQKRQAPDDGALQPTHP